MNFQTKGLILKEYNYGEADKIFVIFTAEKGKISCFAKGVRKSSSRMRGFLQLFTYANFHLHRGKSMHTIIGGEVINSFPRVKNDLLLYGYANYMAEVIEYIIPSEEKNEDIFMITVSYLHLMGSLPASQLTSYYILGLLRATGFLPEFFDCIKCNQEIRSNSVFDYLEGGCVCIDCAKQIDYKRPIPINIIRNIGQLLKMELAQIGRLKIAEKDQFFIEDLLSEYLKFVLEKPINSIKFIREIRGGT